MFTPLVPLTFFSSPQKTIWVKLENENPTGSLKDRIVEPGLNRLLSEGKIKRGDTVVEASSGNTGISLAYYGNKLGLKILICVDAAISKEKKERIKSFGAELREIDTTKNSEAVIEAANSLSNQAGHYYFAQFSDLAHVKAYEQGLAAEILDQLSQERSKIDYLVAGVGSGASLLGVGSVLKAKHNPKLKIIAVSPASSPTKIEGIHPAHIRGDFPIWNSRPKGFEEQRILVDDQAAIKAAADLLKRESLSVGPCSGALLHATQTKLPRMGNFLLLFSDEGSRYEENIK